MYTQRNDYILPVLVCSTIGWWGGRVGVDGERSLAILGPS
jgi:hypothetical protein